MKSRLGAVFLLLLGASQVYAPLARATLGGTSDSVESDRKAFSATRLKSRAFSNYEIHEVQSGANVIREYLSSSGVIFGVAWTGRAHPDLSQLLGTYYSDYQSASGQTPRARGHQPRQVSGNHVIVKTWGHMGSLQGHAYDPSLLPSGVSSHDIQ